MAYFMNVELNRADFETEEDYNRAIIEQNRIEKINQNADITNPVVAKTLLNGFEEHPEMFRTIVGTEFLEVLRENSAPPSTDAKEDTNTDENTVSNTDSNIEADQVADKVLKNSADAVNTDSVKATDKGSDAVAQDNTKDKVKEDSGINSKSAATEKKNVTEKDIKGISLGSGRYLVAAVLIISICFPVVGAALAAILFLIAFVSVWIIYFKKGLEYRTVIASCLCIICFPLGLVLSLAGCMKKIKYVIQNYKLMIYSFLFYLVPIALYLNLSAINRNYGVSTIPCLISVFLHAGMFGKMAFICNIILGIGILIYITVKYIVNIERVMIQYVQDGYIIQNGTGFLNTFLEYPAVILSMFAVIFNIKVIEE